MMIVIETPTAREVIFQRNHALVAAALATELAPDYRPKAWIDTLAAVLEHDNAQAGFTEETHIDKDGAPLGFRNFGENLLQAERVVYEAQFKSKYMMLLVSMHAHALRMHKKDKSPELEDYLARQEALQESMKKHLNIPDAEADEAYLFLRWCDECSLILCENSLTAEPWRIQTGHLKGVEDQYIWQDRDTQLVHMDPWSFEKPRFQVSAEYYVLRGRAPFESSVALQHALLGMMPATRTWTFGRP